MNDKNKNSIKAQEQSQKSFDKIDINGDEKLSFEEFGKRLKKLFALLSIDFWYMFYLNINKIIFWIIYRSRRFYFDFNR